MGFFDSGKIAGNLVVTGLVSIPFKEELGSPRLDWTESGPTATRMVKVAWNDAVTLAQALTWTPITNISSTSAENDARFFPLWPGNFGEFDRYGTHLVVKGVSLEPSHGGRQREVGVSSIEQNMADYAEAVVRIDYGIDMPDRQNIRMESRTVKKTIKGKDVYNFANSTEFADFDANKDRTKPSDTYASKQFAETFSVPREVDEKPSSGVQVAFTQTEILTTIRVSELLPNNKNHDNIRNLVIPQLWLGSVNGEAVQFLRGDKGIAVFDAQTLLFDNFEIERTTRFGAIDTNIIYRFVTAPTLSANVNGWNGSGLTGTPGSLTGSVSPSTDDPAAFMDQVATTWNEGLDPETLQISGVNPRPFSLRDFTKLFPWDVSLKLNP